MSEVPGNTIAMTAVIISPVFPLKLTTIWRRFADLRFSWRLKAKPRPAAPPWLYGG